MYFMDAIQYPFKSQGLAGKLLTVVILMIIPLLNLLGMFVVMGYGLKIIRSVMDGDTDLPEFEFGADFGRGLMIFLLSLIYAIPLFIVNLVVTGMIENGGMLGILGLMLYFVLTIVVSIMGVIAMVRYAISEDTSDFFDFAGHFDIMQNNIGTIVMYYINGIIMAIILGVLMVIGFMLLFVPGLIVMGVALFASFYLYARLGLELGLEGKRKRKTDGSFA
jgi:hypothetical protein